MPVRVHAAPCLCDFRNASKDDLVLQLELLNRARQSPAIYAAWVRLRDVRSYYIGLRKKSFSQHGEDQFVAKYFAGRPPGFYLDIGASHPFRISNTYLLYRTGWRGVTVEPIPFLGALHRKWRPRDRLLPVAVGREPGRLPFFEMTPSVLSTLDRKTYEEYVREGRAVLSKTYDIQVVPLDEVIRLATRENSVDFLSIDIEGLDAEVLESIDLKSFRPELVCVECNDGEVKARIEKMFSSCSYEILTELGCNVIARAR